MPARVPTSEKDVSQLPRWPIASFRLSCADASALVSTNPAMIGSAQKSCVNLTLMAELLRLCLDMCGIQLIYWAFYAFCVSRQACRLRHQAANLVGRLFVVQSNEYSSARKRRRMK